MAMSFAGTDGLLYCQPNSSVTAYPITIFARGKSTDTTNSQQLATYIASSTPYQGFGLFMVGNSVGDPVALVKFGGVQVLSGSGYSSGVWYSCVGRASGATQLDINLDGTTTTGPTTSQAWGSPGPGLVMMGSRKIPGISNPLTGDAACVAIWSVYLNDDECTSLSKGFSPRRIRPQSLVFYTALVREQIALIDQLASGHASFVSTGGTAPSISDHPRTYGM